MAAIETTGISYLGRCKQKGCRTALRVDDAVASIRSSLSVFEYVTDGHLATDPRVGYCVGNYGAYARCPEHGLYPLKTLKGSYNDEKKCDARCMNATGANCDCSCGGANHGAGHY